MSDNRFKIVFDGALQAGVDKTTAQFNLAALFKTDVASVERLFSGQPVALKRDLSAAEAESYLQALRKTGIEARLEAEPPTVELSLADIDDLPASTPPPDTTTYQSPYAPPQARVGDNLPAFGQLKAFTTNGRIGRLRYLAWSAVLMFAALPIAGAIFAVVMGTATASPNTAITIGVVFGGAAIIALVVFSIQIAVQRLHDIGWSGWLWLLTLVPFVGSVFPFVLMLCPGNSGANQYGAPPPPNSTAVKVLAVFPFIGGIIFGVVAATGGLVNLEKDYNKESASYSESSDAAATDEADDAAAESAPPAVDYDKDEKE
ncbi:MULTISPECIES: DUF805 domain-containing protein [Pseudomonas]|uniref:DUF805 domain-containing protein n=1 Tax=Pseudomonas gingeri TaxID=117681 RepID=A0A7Y7WVP4_9PSED|nr:MULTISPECIES: DUF805 domain-containing protein [Pseudomonas]NWB88571.1 DUF805 domain-containing protein [Pseudomonas gingeri]